MNSEQVTETLEAFLQQLLLWKSQLRVVAPDPTELESTLLELHNSLDVIHAINASILTQAQRAIIIEIDKHLSKINELTHLLSGDVNAEVNSLKVDSSFKLYGKLGI